MSNFLEVFQGDVLIWIGILFCISQSAMFSGLNLAFFSLNRLQLEIATSNENKAAALVLNMRQDSNFLLTTILWGNVSINVLLTLLSDSVLAGVSAFLFSTVFITLFGEITPQAYFSRHALKTASILAPVLRFYQCLLYPVAKPVALLLDAWLGKEGITYMRERDLHQIIKKHMEAEEAEVDHLEGIGALNFLQIDDIPVCKEGELIDPNSIIQLPTYLDLPIIPEFEQKSDDPFLKQLQCSGYKWVILVNKAEEPLLVIDADGFLRAALYTPKADFRAYDYCHRPIVISEGSMPLGDAIGQLKKGIDPHNDEDIKHDIILLWAEQRRIITGSDILGRLLHGINIQPA
ncbi:MAG: metal transporter CNNM [Pseudohongiellaceae bacterium]|jgi:metal transporter CNNM